MICEIWGQTPSGQPVARYTLQSPEGLCVRILSLGGIVQSLLVPDRQGNLREVVLGFDTLAEYLAPHPYIGPVVGRYANRIAYGRFELDGQSWQVPANLPPHHLHGGPEGFDRQVWDATETTLPDGREALKMSYLSPDGDQGFPGKLLAEVTFALTARGGLQIVCKATCESPTIVNLTHHAYFNLAGQGDVCSHTLTIHADTVVEADETLIPTGHLMPVEGTAFDFRQGMPIGARIGDSHPQLRFGHGYDHHFVFRDHRDPAAPVAVVYEPDSGLSMSVFTTKPGVQLYTANHLRDLPGRGGVTYMPHSGFCLETQLPPDSPNQPGFPSPVLRPGEVYDHVTEYVFEVR
ncbi:MAG: aldose epimerase family protein [Bacteroidia bacterium]|nr:aldose epimerase family protein [Bacteroidia bacterium]